MHEGSSIPWGRASQGALRSDLVSSFFTLDLVNQKINNLKGTLSAVTVSVPGVPGGRG